MEGMFGEKLNRPTSYSGDHRKGEGGRGAAGKGTVFGVLKRQDKVYMMIINDTKS